MSKEKFKRILGGIVRYLVASVSLAIILYVLVALIFSTDEERRLIKENRLYSQMYSALKAKESLIGDTVEGLLEKDGDIYEDLFETEPPSLDAITAADVIADSDSLSESFYLASSATKSESLMKMASQVDSAFAEVFRLLQERRDSIPPLTRPLRDISYVQTGASLGMKNNPVYKVEVRHDGLDLIAPQGAPVYAAAAGTVTKVTQSRKGLGNTVEIDHGNGYRTRYCLLGEILTAKGRTVRLGQKIGTVGISSQVSAPHLHYEVLRDTLAMDPVNYLFSSVSPEEYSRMVYMAASTTQSMD